MQKQQSSLSTKKNISFNKSYFISKNELLSWINDLLKVNMTLVEQLGSGTMYCQIFDVIHPGQIPLLKVKWNAKLEYDFIHNLKILQQAFDKMQVQKAIPVNRLAKTKYQDNLEFAQWMKAYFDQNCKDKGKCYDAVKRRGNAVPYFGFCKGGVLPKQTLFYRNPNEKFTLDDISNNSFSSNHEQEFINDDTQSHVHIPTKNEDSLQNKCDQFFSNQPQNNKFDQLSQSNFFSRGESQSKNQQQDFFTNNQNIKNESSNFFTRNEEPKSINQSYNQGNQNFFERKENQLNNLSTINMKKDQQILQKSLGSIVPTMPQNNFFKDNQSQNENISLNTQTLLPLYDNQNINSNNTVSQNSYLNLSNRYLNNNLFSKISQTNNYSLQKQELSRIDRSEKKTTMTTDSLISKIQQLTEASQLLLRKNGDGSEKKSMLRIINREQIQSQPNEEKLPYKSDQVDFIQKFASQQKENQTNQDMEINKYYSTIKQNQIINKEIDFSKQTNSDCPIQNQGTLKNFSSQKQSLSKYDISEQNDQNIYMKKFNEDSTYFEKLQQQKGQSSLFFKQDENEDQKANYQQQQSKILNNNLFDKNNEINNNITINENMFFQRSDQKQQQEQTEQQVEKARELNTIVEKQPQKSYSISKQSKIIEREESSDKYETPICKKQKKEEDETNFTRQLDIQNQQTVKLINDTSISENKAQNSDTKSPTQFDNQNKIQQILSVINQCNENYDIAMQQIINICKI